METLSRETGTHYQGSRWQGIVDTNAPPHVKPLLLSPRHPLLSVQFFQIKNEIYFELLFVFS